MNQIDSCCSLLVNKMTVTVYHITEKYFFHLSAEKILISPLNTGFLLFNPQTEVSLDEGLLFFMSSGEEGSTLDWYSEQVGFLPLPLMF